jgi:hypothetical protein
MTSEIVPRIGERMAVMKRLRLRPKAQYEVATAGLARLAPAT